MKKVRVGIIGMGGIATHVHVPGLLECPDAQITAVCDVDPARLNEAGDRLKLPASRRFTDYRALLACPDVDAVEICTPNYLHVPMAADALKAGKSVNIEKPLALSLAQAKPLIDVPLAPEQVVMLCFSYRFKPAVRYAKALIDQGGLGRMTGLQIAYLKDSALWPGRKLEWRFEKEKAGTGVLGDLGVHLLDMAQLLAGDITRVCARTQIVVSERPRPDGSGMAPVETDDMCSFLAQMANGADATFTISRCAYGQKNTILFDVYGTEGSLSFNLNEPDSLWIAGEALAPEQPELHRVDVPAEYRASQEATFINAVLGRKAPYFPSLQDGLKSQRLLDAILLSSQESRWIALS